MPKLFILYESAIGYGLFEKTESQEIGEQTEQVQQSIVDPSLFKKMLKLKAFLPFESAESALENCNDVSEGNLNPTLKNFLSTNFPDAKVGKLSSKYSLGLGEEKLGSAIQENLGINCSKTPIVQELIRGLRLHITKMIPELKEGDIERAQLGLGHSYSRAKVKFNVNRVDNMIIQAIALLDQLDKDVNTFSMRCREWYSWHFPEMSRIVTDQLQFARVAKLIGDKAKITDEMLPGITEIVGDESVATQVIDASRASMGQDISDIDLINIEKFADRVIELSEYRLKLHGYLTKKMTDVAPNLSALIGEQVGARLISHAGSLTNLSKMPASTVQILGAEKALFRALKTRGNTPKYGLIYHSSFIGRAGAKNKGRISRYLANKCSIASRIDNFLDTSTPKFGEKMKEQVEERLAFYESGTVPRKNVDVMKEVLEEVEKDGLLKAEADKKDKKKKRKEKKGAEMEVEVEAAPVEKKKKRRQSEEAAPVVVEEEAAPQKRDKKKKKSKN
jgi:nucleolar protein 56